MGNGVYNGLDLGMHNGLYSGLHEGSANGLYANETKDRKQVIKNGLVLSYDANKFNQNSFSDLSGCNNNSTLLNGAKISNRLGVNAVYFDGVDDYAFKTSTPSITGNYTVMMWVYSYNTTSNAVYYIFSGTSGANGIYLGGSAVSNCFGFFNTGIYNSGVTVSPNRWYHTAMSFYINQITYEVTLYLDGKQIYLDKNAIYLSVINQINIGRRGDNFGYTNCLIPIVQIYNRTLKPEEVSYNYSVHKSRFTF